jgi:hypothetical protein
MLVEEWKGSWAVDNRGSLIPRCLHHLVHEEEISDGFQMGPSMADGRGDCVMCIVS